DFGLAFDFGRAFFGFFGRVLVAFRLRLLVHLFFGFFRRFALGAPFLHLLHRLAVVVQAEVPGAAAEGLDFQPRGLVADRAALLQPEDVAALRQREGLVARFRIVGLRFGFPARAADEPFAGFFRPDDPQHVGRAVLLGPPRFLADLAGAEDAVLVHP